VAPATGPPSPPGPSEYELRLLGQYGDAARQRIRSQARNPEHGAEGAVKLEFEVARDGHLIDTWVYESSGHILLDNDALEATRAAFNDAREKVPFPSDVKVDRWVFQLALEYPLY
jgi:TonB family protein